MFPATHSVPERPQTFGESVLLLQEIDTLPAELRNLLLKAGDPVSLRFLLGMAP